MSFKKVIVSSAAALAILSGSASAATQVELDGTGDYLLMPATYITESGDWQTDLKIVNTNTTNAIVARAVIRRGDTSAEIFDFPLYLTPGDVWIGTLQKGDANPNNLVVKTSDDSAMLWDGLNIIHADKVAGGLEITGPKATPISDPYIRKTYIEVFGLASYDATNVPLGGFAPYIEAVQNGHPLDKTKFFEYVRQVSNGHPFVPGLVASLNDIRLFDAVDVNDNDILGKQTIYTDAGSASGKRSMIYNAIAMTDFSSAPRTAGVIGGDTTLSGMSNHGVQTVADLELALSKDKVYVMYEADEGTLNPFRVHFTDPVKKYHDELTELDQFYMGSGTIGEHFYEFNNTVGRNMEENISSCIPEQGFTDISGQHVDSLPCNPTLVHDEVYTIDFGSTHGSVSNGMVDYRFPEGGYLTFKPDTNLTANPFPALVPTTFTYKYIGGTGLNNHIDNQYLLGVD